MFFLKRGWGHGAAEVVFGEVYEENVTGDVEFRAAVAGRGGVGWDGGPPERALGGLVESSRQAAGLGSIPFLKVDPLGKCFLDPPLRIQ